MISACIADFTCKLAKQNAEGYDDMFSGFEAELQTDYDELDAVDAALIAALAIAIAAANIACSEPDYGDSPAIPDEFADCVKAFSDMVAETTTPLGFLGSIFDITFENGVPTRIRS